LGFEKKGSYQRNHFGGAPETKKPNLLPSIFIFYGDLDFFDHPLV
jgi:hypothetical protein